MKRIAIFLLIFFGLMFVSGCVKTEPDNIAVTINKYVISPEEFQEEFKASGYYADGEKKKDFLEDLINRKLILQEAERQGLDKEQEFLKEVERFWEKALLKNIIERTSRELSASAQVTEDAISARYDEMLNQGLIQDSYEKAYDQIRWQLLREEQFAAFSKWLEELRTTATIKVRRQLLEMD